MLLQAFQLYKLSILDITVVSGSKELPPNLVSHTYLIFRNSEILNIFYFSQLSATTWKFYMNHIVKGGYIWHDSTMLTD